AENKTPTEKEREDAQKALAKQGVETNDLSVIDGYIKEQAIQAEINGSGWQVGGDKRRIVESGTALIQGLISGDVNKAVANASAPYIANEIAKQIPKENQEGRIIAHGIANVALALAKGENAGAQSLGAMTGEAVGMLSVELYGKTVGELTEDEKATVSAFASLAAGIAGGLVGGDTSSAANAAEAGKTTVENNLLSNKFGVDKLDDKGKALQKKLEDAGIGGVDDLQTKFVGCNGNADCERNVRNEYRNQEKAAGEKLVGLYQSGQLSKDEFNYLVTEYTTAMLLGIEQGEKLSDTGFDWIGDIYRLSGSDWTVAGQINNPYFNEIRTTELIVEWKAQGMSDEKIQEKLQKDSTFGGLIAPVDVKSILNLVDNGASKEDLAKAATGIALAKVLQGKKNNTSKPDTGEHKVVEIKSGGKGDWNKQLNKPEPNTIYKVDGNNTYRTDSQGRVQSVEAKLSLNTNDRNSYQQCKAGKCGIAGDEGGHLIGTRFNGPGEKINIVPMNSNLNRVEWKKMENSWAEALKNGKQVNVKIEPVYSGNSARPTKFNVKYTIEGERPVIKNFTNTQGGN
ncbi:TPA: DNA/RNA non-specific endonuclease, partial [Providencia rettgeri]